MKHTPGPFMALKYPDAKTWTVAAPKVGSVASKVKSREDANLMAAAPDLLQELRMLLIQTCGEGAVNGSHTCQRCVCAQAAIRKAEEGE